MKKKLAHINFMDNYKQIKIKNKFFLYFIPNYISWYIKKYNPILIEEKNVLGMEVLDVKIPITIEDASKDTERFNLIINNTLDSLLEYKAGAIILPEKFENILTEKIPIMTGKYLFPFFILPIIKKLLKIKNKDIKKAEVLIIDTNETLTDVLIEILYADLNYLTIVTKNVDSYIEMAESIFQDTGLNLNVVTKTKNSFKNADIIIDTYNNGECNFFYKKGALYIDMGNSNNNLSTLINERQDILAIDSCSVGTDNAVHSLKEIEAYVYLECREFRDIFSKGFNNYNVEKIMKYIKADFKVNDLMQLGKILKNRHFTKYTAIANIDN